MHALRVLFGPAAVCTALAALFFIPLAAVADWTPRSPDIYLIVADDLGIGDIGSAKIPTPHIGSLAAEGMSFTASRAAASICAPTRYSIETGRYPWRIEPRIQLWTNRPPIYAESTLGLAKLLKAKGYTTYTFGKWHAQIAWPKTKDGKRRKKDWSNTDWQAPIGLGPLTRGYDYFFGGRIAGGVRSFIENDRVTIAATEWSTAWRRPGPAAPGWDDRDYHGRVTDRLIEKIQQAGPGPIFIHYQPFAPHKPILPEERFIGSSDAGLYGDFVFQLDHSVGRIRAAIAARGRPAVVFFTSDNGSGGYDGTGPDFGRKGSVVTCCDHKPNGNLRGWKHSIHEGGVRVPLIVWWPGVVAQGTNADQVLTTDYCRTIARIVGFSIPSDQCIDSFDFWPSAATTAGRIGLKRTTSVVQNVHGDFALIHEHWKVIPNSEELCDLSAKRWCSGLWWAAPFCSEGEYANLWSQAPQKRRDLIDRLEAATSSSATYRMPITAARR